MLVTDAKGDALSEGTLNMDTCTYEIVMMRMRCDVSNKCIAVLLQVEQRGGEVR